MSSPMLFPDLEPPVYPTGILPSHRIRELLDSGRITASFPLTDDQLQPASLDLRLGPVAYRVRASFLPGRQGPVTDRIEKLTMHQLDLSTPAILERNCAYIIPALEEISLPRGVSGRANPKSTTGRLDVLTRLITEYGTEFDGIPEGYRGRLYLEVVPRTFSVMVRMGDRLSQVRFVRGNPPDSDREMASLHQAEALVYGEDDLPDDAVIQEGVWLSANLQEVNGSKVVGYKARPYAPLIDLARVDYYEAEEFWEPVRPRGSKYLVLNPGDFYLLTSREKVSVPPSHAAEMIGYDPSFGELRVHYAGFFDPGFGYRAGGTRAVLEVRSHDVPFILEHEQRVARLIFRRLLSAPDRLYGPDIGSSYQGQGLALSKQFKSPTPRSPR